MRVDNLEVYESWQVSVPTIYHSYLNHLAPIGVGTPLVESLTSYIARLAASHTMNVGTLLEREISRLIEKKCGATHLLSISRFLGAVNGVGSTSQDLVWALERLTMHQDLNLLTMLSFSDVIPSRNLFRSVRAWCPACYQEWQERGNSLYEPLLWLLKVVKYCPVHQTPLIDKCSNCQHSNPPLSREFQLGFCSRCHTWLGQTASKNNASIRVTELELWKVESLGALLTLTPSSREKLSATNLTQQLSMLANEVTEGNIAALARRLKVPKNTLWLWHSGEVLPLLESSLNICAHFKLSLVDFFTGEVGESLDLDNWQLPKRQPSPGNADLASSVVRGESFDLKVARCWLERELSQSEHPPISVSEVARRLGCHRRVLYKYFPDLCSAIAVIYKNYRQQSHQENVNYCCQQVREIVVQLYAEGQYPSEGRVVALMDKPALLRYEEVRSALQLARTDLRSTASLNKP
ncbi:TniQ family protein [Chamaesiphon sp.]|uniref:TniQ family protein n=1 Tax=Chamaesiphon sp. TaxID=2814140 RepID=UPI0035942BBE